MLNLAQSLLHSGQVSNEKGLEMKMTKRFAPVIAALAVAAPGLAGATPLNYYGALFDLSVVDIGAPGGQYQVTYTADFTSFDSGQAALQPYIAGIAWKLPGADVKTANLLSYTLDGWGSATDSVLNASGCSGTGGNTWACAEDSVAPYFATAGLLSWDFVVTFDGGSLSTLDTTGASLKALFVDATGKQAGLLSCTLGSECAASVPEPATFGILGLGLLGMGVARRKRSNDSPV